MSRHRNVRSMRYSDEYDGYDDVYGHSVEEDYPMSPSDAAFFYDRNNRNPQLSSFLSAEDNIQEEDDESTAGNNAELDRKTKDCLELMRNVVGETKTDEELISVLVRANYDVQLAINLLLSSEESSTSAAAPKPARPTTDRRRGKEVKKKVPIRNSPSFNVVQFFKSQVYRKIDLLGASLSGPGSSKDELRKINHPLLNKRVSTLGYYLCKKSVETPSFPVVSVPMKIPDDIEPFKFNVNSPDDATVVKTSAPVATQDGPAPVVMVVSASDKGNVIKGFNIEENVKSKLNLPSEEKKDKSPTPAGSQTPVGSRTPLGSRTPRGVSPVPGVEGTPSSRSSEVKSLRDGAKAEENYKTERGDMKDHLHMVVTGHVDAGKSTLMGHVLYKLGLVNSKTMHKYEQESKKIGKQSFIYAWILDETGEERTRGITMDVGQSKFETKTKLITLLDAPGHKDFIPNMITGAAQADVALLVVDSTRGEFETGFESGGQTREHALLVRSLGVNQLCVVVNKLDTVDWNEARFKEICAKLGAFLKQAGFKDKDVTYVPCSGLTGENLTERSSNELLKKWYNGPCLVDVIDQFQCPPRSVAKPLRISINDVYKGTGSGFCISGRVETGMVAVADKVLVLPQNEIALVKAVTIDEMPTQNAYAGDYVNLTLAQFDQQNIAVGYILSDPAFPVPVTSKFEARIVVFNVTVPITRGYPVVLHMQCLAEQAVITKLLAQLHKNTGEVIKKKPRCLTKNSNAIVVVETSKPICVELYKDMKELGRFMLRLGGVTIAAGLITKIMNN